MVDGYFKVHPSQISGYKSTLIPDSDILPLDTLINVLVLFQDETKAIILARLDAPTIAELQAQTGCENPMSIEAVEILDIVGSDQGEAAVWKILPGGINRKAWAAGHWEREITIRGDRVN